MSHPTERNSDSVDPTDQTLLRRFHKGEQDAASALYLRYAGRLQNLAHEKTSAELSRRVASEEIVQSVFRTFFRRVSDGQYLDVDGEDLWRLFLVIALNKIRSNAEFHRAQKRDVRKTKSAESDLHHLNGSENGQEEVALAVLKMTVDELLRDLPAVHAEIVRLRIEGFTLPEIADRTQRSQRTTERVLQNFKQKLLSIIED